MAASSYRQLAEKTLLQAAQQLATVPKGEVRTDAMAAHAAMAQAIATVAATQALLEIGDVLRENLKRGDN